MLQIGLLSAVMGGITRLVMNEKTDYQNVIQAELARRCERNPRYSLRSFAKAAKVDVGGLSRILANKALPSAQVAEKLARFLDLSPKQQRCFMASIAKAHQARSYRRLSPPFHKELLDDREGSAAEAQRELSAEMFRVIADWYHYAILELTFAPGFRAEPAWIASELGISATEAKLAVRRLFELGLLERKGARVRKTDAHLTTGDKQLTSSAHRRRQRQVLEKALFSLENDPVEIRSHTGMTMAVDPKRIPHAKEMILKFNRELAEYLEGGDRSQVYELSVALLPLQRRSMK